MCKYRLVRLFLVISVFCLTFQGIILADYIDDAKSSLSERTISGIRDAYESTHQALSDPQFPQTRELLFLNALSRTGMLFVRDDGGSMNSFLELIREYDLELSGDYTDTRMQRFIYPKNNRGRYEIPADAPDMQTVGDTLDSWLMPEIDAIIDVLDQIDSPEGDEFEVIFTPSQTGMMMNVRIGYGEVLILKGMLLFTKSSLNSPGAYDQQISNIDIIIEKLYADCFSINDDLLISNPDFLRLLPTSNDPANGKDVLAQAASDLIAAIGYTIDAMDYIINDDFYQPDTQRFIYIAPEDIPLAQAAIGKLSQLRDSLSNDGLEFYDMETYRTYELSGGSFSIGTLFLEFDLIEQPIGGYLSIQAPNLPPAWDVSDVYAYQSGVFELELEAVTPMYLGGGYMIITLDNDKAVLTDGYVNYWGSTSGELYNISGMLGDVEAEKLAFDPNPIYGSTPRYPDPLSLRDLLPEFDRTNAPLPDTVGAGLGNDATLGGALPDFTQQTWQMDYNLQPEGEFMIPELYAWQRIYESYYGYNMTAFWFDKQIVFQDIAGDVDSDASGNLDIDRLYMAMSEGLFSGEIVFNDLEFEYYAREYEIIFSYTPGAEEVEGTIKIVLSVQGIDYIQMDVFEWNNDGCYGDWNMPAGGYYYAMFTERGLQFNIDLYDYCPMLIGKYVSVNSYEVSDFIREDGDINETHIRVGPLGNIYGNVAAEGFSSDTPIFVEAFTDICSPEDSRVSCTRIDQAGDFVLQGIGLGWKGYVRAFTPVFGFENPFELECLAIEDIVKVSQWQPQVFGVGLDLQYPQILMPGDCGIADLGGDMFAPAIFAFDAIAGMNYSFSMNIFNLGNMDIAIYAPDGDTEVFEFEYWYGEEFWWHAEMSGRYYIVVEQSYYDISMQDGYIELCINSDLTHYYGDIASISGIGAKDGFVDIYDLHALTSCWLESCTAPQWCIFADIDHDGNDNIGDMSAMAGQWLDREPAPIDIEWVYIQDPGVPGHEGFAGEMGKYEISNGQYCRFLNNAMTEGLINVQGAYVYSLTGDVLYTLSVYSMITYDGTFRVRPHDAYDMEDFAVVEVSWYGAQAFCDYYGVRLPTEWEWQAVADYDGTYIYGCGLMIDPMQANFGLNNPIQFSEMPFTNPEGYFFEYGYGLCDMSGNAMEWTASSIGYEKVLRGGSWASNYIDCSVSHRSTNTPETTTNQYGFRVCR
ncbi:MAG: formylglycine-generating enzyme family protein [Sedimentisphaeraceae bacterium JB056]